MVPLPAAALDVLYTAERDFVPVSHQVLLACARALNQAIPNPKVRIRTLEVVSVTVGP